MSTTAITKPLGILYDLAAHEGNEDWYSLGAAAARALLETRQWHKFIIGPEIPELIVPCQYAEQLRQHGLFRLPFDQVVVQYGPGNVHRNLHVSMPAHLRRLLDKDGERRGDEEFYIAIIEQKQETIEGRSFVINPDSLSIVKSLGRCTFQLSRGCDEWMEDKSAGYITDDPLLAKDTVGYFEEKANFAITAFVLVGLINAEGIDVEDHRAPKFINKKREAKGKLPLFEYHLLKINPALKMPGHVATGGTHASPRLHWRRGHIRRLSSGELTQVRPCLVGHKSLGRIEKDYVVGGNSTEAPPVRRRGGAR